MFILLAIAGIFSIAHHAVATVAISPIIFGILYPNASVSCHISVQGFQNVFSVALPILLAAFSNHNHQAVFSATYHSHCPTALGSQVATSSDAQTRFFNP